MTAPYSFAPAVGGFPPVAGRLPSIALFPCMRDVSVVTICCAGAGKTSLMDILAGRRYGSGVSGSVHLNGNAVDASDMRRFAGCGPCAASPSWMRCNDGRHLCACLPPTEVCLVHEEVGDLMQSALTSLSWCMARCSTDWNCRKPTTSAHPV